ncbi:MAG: hypothetical protein AAGF12_22395 [Myxococcota bacterium]
MAKMTWLLMLSLGAGCGLDQASESGGTGTRVKAEPGKADSSAEAVFVDFTFDGELRTRSFVWDAAQEVENQLLYTIGHLNGDRSVGRLDRVILEDIETSQEDGVTVVRYRASMPVAWGEDTVPSDYELRLPHDMSGDALEAFAEKYGHDCVDSSAHDVDAGVMWYYYRPEAYRCELDPSDVIVLEATVAPSPIQTTGKFPEYHRVWEDDALKVVAVFGKAEDGATSDWDAGISGYNAFSRGIVQSLAEATIETTPETLPRNPGVEMPEVSFAATLPDGKRVEVVSILVDNVRTAGPEFDARYEELSSDADLIFYNGHAGLGANIRALAAKGHWVPGQYAIVFMNGCDTYAYVDSALWDAHARVNPDDPEGTKYLDVITNALPSYFRSMPQATLALIEGLLAYDEPRTYEQIFRDIDRAQVVLVSGEADNEFVPGGGGEPGGGFEGLEESGYVAQDGRHRFSTPVLDTGSYTFVLSGDGDADLYLRVGTEPSEEVFDCRPYHYGSAEECQVEIGTPAPVHLMVHGYRPANYRLVGAAN